MHIYGSWGSIFDSGFSHPWSLLSGRTRWSIRSIFTLQENDETMTTRNNLKLNGKQEKPITRTFYWTSTLNLDHRIFTDRTVLRVVVGTISHEKFNPDLDHWLFLSLGNYQICKNSYTVMNTVCEFTVTQIFRIFFSLGLFEQPLALS